MLKCKIDKTKDSIKVKAGGTLSALMNETMTLIKIIYENMKKQNPEVADEYKRTLQAAIIDPNSPLFKSEWP